MRGLAMLLAGALLAAGCGEATDTAANGDASTTPRVRVNTVDGAPELATAVGVEGTAVAQTWAWGEHPFTWSDDDGQNWQPSSTPADRSIGGTQQLVALGDTLVVVAAPTSLPVSHPGIWRSIDSGQSFQQATGVSESDEEGVVTDVVEVDDRLIAIGVMRPGKAPMAGLEQPLASRWVSDDRGMTWTRTELPPSTPIATSLAAMPDGTLIATGSSNARSADSITAAPAIRSTDQGRSWVPLEIPGLRPHDLVMAPKVIGDTVYVSVDSTTWASIDGGKQWTKLGGAPAIVDSEGTSPKSATLQIQAGSQHVLTATVQSHFDNEHSLATPAFSDDDGARWHAASFPVHCDGNDAKSTLSEFVEIEGVLVAAWNCSGGGNHGGRLLTSVDEGRTWQVKANKATTGMDLSAPVRVTEDQALLWAGPNAERSPRVMLTVQPAH